MIWTKIILLLLRSTFACLLGVNCYKSYMVIKRHMLLWPDFNKAQTDTWKLIFDSSLPNWCPIPSISPHKKAVSKFPFHVPISRKLCILNWQKLIAPYIKNPTPSLHFQVLIKAENWRVDRKIPCLPKMFICLCV